jgi:hypothetical protein
MIHDAAMFVSIYTVCWQHPKGWLIVTPLSVEQLPVIFDVRVTDVDVAFCTDGILKAVQVEGGTYHLLLSRPHDWLRSVNHSVGLRVSQVAASI